MVWLPRTEPLMMKIGPWSISSCFDEYMTSDAAVHLPKAFAAKLLALILLQQALINPKGLKSAATRILVVRNPRSTS